MLTAFPRQEPTEYKSSSTEHIAFILYVYKTVAIARRLNQRIYRFRPVWNKYPSV